MISSDLKICVIVVLALFLLQPPDPCRGAQGGIYLPPELSIAEDLLFPCQVVLY